jgi:dimethylhistidine N-methyltransferase
METKGKLEIVDMKPELTSFLDEVFQGLTKVPKEINPKYFYDSEGSKLFEEITELQEYYPTRTEKEILLDHIDEINGLFQGSGALFEYGSGGSKKTRIILDYCKSIIAYVPMDISKTQLEESSRDLLKKYPDLKIVAICVDYTKPFEIPFLEINGNIVAIFLGSSIGNFEPDKASQFLWNAMEMLGPDDRILIGFDLIKNKEVLEAAYNDKKGITAKFNLNLIKRINMELGTNLNLTNFKHVAFYNRIENRIEMHLQVLKDCSCVVNGKQIYFKKGELIHTENSYKYSIEGINKLANQNNLITEKYWTDKNNYFSIFCLRKME